MNERIRQLAHEAGLPTYNPEGVPTKLEKFAELIVRECVRHFNEDYQRDFDTLWREDLSKSIKEHFGVEE
jgi:hypothetical protein